MRRFIAVPIAAGLDGALVLESNVSHIAGVQIPIGRSVDARHRCCFGLRSKSAPFGEQAFDISAYFFEFTWLAWILARVQLVTRRISLGSVSRCLRLLVIPGGFQIHRSLLGVC